MMVLFPNLGKWFQMRHGNKINKLGRVKDHRRALMKNMASSLFVSGYIRTTKAKAKALRPYAERIITKAVRVNKATTLSQRLALIRNIQTEITMDTAFTFLIKVWGVLCMNRPGGYTRIIKLNRRIGDASEMAIIGIVIDDKYIEKYNLTDMSFKGAFQELAKKLLDDIFPIKKMLRFWEYSQMPNIDLNVSIPRNRNNLSFEIKFNRIVDLEGANWPIFNGRYSDMPFLLEIDCPDSYSLQYSFINKGLLKEIPIISVRHNVYKAIFSPIENSQSLSGKVIMKTEEKKITALEYCEVVIYGPGGRRIFSKNLLSDHHKKDKKL